MNSALLREGVLAPSMLAIESLLLFLLALLR
jgi:hypothetical protein